MTTHPSPGHLDDEILSLATDTINVPIARRFARDVAGASGIAGSVLADLELVTSELVTNAIEHALGDRVEIRVRVEAPRHATARTSVEISVTSIGNAGGVPPAELWRVAGPDSVAGRGLGIVRALADRIEVHHHDDRVTVVVCLDDRPAG